jgi:hypothetical protein
VTVFMSTGKGDLEAAFQAFDLQVLPGDTVRTARKDYSHRWKPSYPGRASLRLAFFVRFQRGHCGHAGLL